MPRADGGAQFGRDAIERGWMSREQASICFREAQARGEDFSLIAQQRGFLTAGQIALLHGLHVPQGPNYQAFANRLPTRSPEPDEADEAQTIRITAPSEDVDPNAQTFVGAIRNEDLPDFLKPGARAPLGYDPNAQTFVGRPPAFIGSAAEPPAPSFDPAAQTLVSGRAGTQRKTSPRIPPSFDPSAQTIIGELSPLRPNEPDGAEQDFDPSAKTFVGAIADDDRPDFLKTQPEAARFDPSAQTIIGDFKSPRRPQNAPTFDPSAPTIFGLKAPSAEPDSFDPSAQTLMGEVPVSPDDLDPLGQTLQLPGPQRFPSGVQRRPETGLKQGSAQVPIADVDPRAVTLSASPRFSIQNPQISSTAPGELSPAKPGSALLGSEISGWRLERELGRGATGVVYSVTRASEKAAMKLLGELDEAGRKRFQRELMAALAVSDQENVVRVLETGFHRERPFIVMELVEGRSLAAELAKSGRFEATKALELMLQVTQAVVALHRRSLIHRDIKPENILLRKSDGQALVTDFGLARALNADTLTRSGDWVGTPQYMSPEQINGLRDQVDERSDIWALGATFYETLLARPAFEGEDLPSLVNAIVDEDPPALTSLRPELPKAWDQLIARSLCKSREGRFASATQMLEALQKLQKLALIQARPPGPLKRLWLSLVRRLGRGLASLLILVALVAPLAMLASYQLQARSPFAERCSRPAPTS